MPAKPKKKLKKKKKGPSMTQNAPQPDLDAKNRGLIQAWNQRTLPASDRAQMVVFNICEFGMDYIPAIAHLIKDSDEAGKTGDMLKSLAHEPLITERYIGPATINPVGGLPCGIGAVKYARVTKKDGTVCLPCEITDDLKQGDLVLISDKAQRIVAKDGNLSSTGYVTTVESIPEGGRGQVIVKADGGQMQVAWLHHTLLESPPGPGDKVIFDEKHSFALSRISTETKGNELLTEITKLPTVRRNQVGSPHPVAEQVVNHFRDSLERPEWIEQLGTRDRRGYLFVGQTGGGKSYHVKLIATEIHDLVEEHTGTRTSRVFMCDASQFWDPYFGATEQKINAWAKKIEALGSQKLKDKDGHEIKVPLLGVIEECEALFRSRGGDEHGSGHLFDRVLSLLLQKLESAEDAIGVPIVWVCTSNRPDLIDAAAMRRIGMRKAIFGNLTAQATHDVMVTKTQGMNVNYERIAAEIVRFLHESDEGQAIAQVVFRNKTERVLHRRELVTPSILEEAVSFAADQCMSRSREANRLQKVSAADIVEFLDKHFNHMARTLTKDNLPEHCPEWFAEDASPVATVKAVRR